MNQNELMRIRTALTSPKYAIEIIPVCRQILRNRLSNEELRDRNLRYLLEDLIDQLDFSCIVQLTETMLPMPVSHKKQNNIFLWGAVGVLGLFALVAESKGLRIVGGLAALGGGLGAGYTWASKLVPPQKSYSLKLVTTAENIMERLDAIYGCVKAFFSYKQLEGTHRGILRWFQDQYAETDSPEYRKSIERLLAKYGYKFENFTEEKTSEFEVSAANVEQLVTTIPLLIDKEEETVLRGHVVVPMKKNN